MCGVRTAYNSISTHIDTQNMRDGRGRHRERERAREREREEGSVIWT